MPKMAFYRKIYAESPRWDGAASLDGKHIIVYCEQGFGDIIQFARYLPALKDRGCRVTLHCPADLHRLLDGLADEFLDKSEEVLPTHDFHVLSMSLPFALGITDPDFASEPYLCEPEPMELPGFESGFKVGIAWEGNPDHSNNNLRSCPLSFFRHLDQIAGVRYFVLQKHIHDPSLVAGCEDMDLNGVELDDFYDTAQLVSAMDLIVSVDTSVLHLAGALGKPAYCLLSHSHDHRWSVGRWYPSVKVAKQESTGDWDSVFSQVLEDMGLKTVKAKTQPVIEKQSVLITGGIGDVIALESYMTDEERAGLESVYYASRAHKPVRALIEAMGDRFPSLKRHEVLWDDWTKMFCFYSKGEIPQKVHDLPDDWPRTADWSILNKFSEIQKRTRKYTGSGLVARSLADVSHLNLPAEFVAVVPYSDNDPNAKGRAFDFGDWSETLHFLHRRRLKGVVLAVGDRKIPDDPSLVDLTNKTTIVEAVEVLRLAKGYVGVDSCLSVVAAKLFDDILVVKSRNPHLYEWRSVYYAPKKTFDFIMPRVKLPGSIP